MCIRDSSKTYSQSDANPLAIKLVDTVSQIWSVDICLTEYATFYFHVCDLPLPITLISFIGEKKGVHNLIQWVTEDENGIEYYEIEYSKNTNNWKTLAQEAAKGNNKPDKLNYYNILHEYPSRGLLYYRLKIVSFDGSIELSLIHI